MPGPQAGATVSRSSLFNFAAAASFNQPGSSKRSSSRSATFRFPVFAFRNCARKKSLWIHRIRKPVCVAFADIAYNLQHALVSGASLPILFRCGDGLAQEGWKFVAELFRPGTPDARQAFRIDGDIEPGRLVGPMPTDAISGNVGHKVQREAPAQGDVPRFAHTELEQTPSRGLRAVDPAARRDLSQP